MAPFNVFIEHKESLVKEADLFHSLLAHHKTGAGQGFHFARSADVRIAEFEPAEVGGESIVNAEHGQELPSEGRECTSVGLKRAVAVQEHWTTSARFRMRI